MRITGTKYFIISLVFILVILFSGTMFAQDFPDGTQQGQLSPLNPFFEEYMVLLQEDELELYTEEGYPLGYIPPPLQRHSGVELGKEIILPQTTLPDKFDLREVDRIYEIRDQGDAGACWAFATYGSLESYLKPWEKRNFSENHLKNTHGFDFDHDVGGHEYMSMAYLARWSGPVNEYDDPYNEFSGDSPPSLEPVKHVQQVDFISWWDIEEVKQTLYDGGAIYTAMFWDDHYYDASNNSYYYSFDEWDYWNDAPNHDVVIIGWDDNYSKNFFDDNPPNDGAFILRNSWGEDFGDGGYFYMSYYDFYAGFSATAFHNAEPTNNYNRIYDYDPLGWVQSYGIENEDTYYGANIFTAEDNEYLVAVSFYSYLPGTSYEIDVYTGVDWDDPISGGNQLNQSGTLDKGGYHTIPLDNNVALTGGDRFSVVVKFTSPDPQDWPFPVPVELSLKDYSSDFDSNPGESFLSDDGYNWYDAFYAEGGPLNVCIKAFSSTFDEPLPPGQSFSDVPPTHPFHDEIETMAASGITTGYDDGTFRPAANVTRQAMAAFLVRGLKLDQSYNVPFQPTFGDVPMVHPFYEEIELLAASGITTGYDDGTFRPAAIVTRQAMAAFLARGLELDRVYDVPAQPTFPDVSVHHPFFDEIELLAASGITTGYDDGTFRPSANVTRQAMAAFLVRGLEVDQPSPFIGVNPEDNLLFGYDWPCETEITITVGDAEFTTITGDHDEDWQDCTNFFYKDDALELEAGDLVMVTDGVTVREHIVKYLHIDEINMEANTISGRAAPNDEVRVAVWGDQRVERHVQSDAEGFWFADFSQAVGDEPWEQGHDIKAGDQGSAFQFDEQGNYTVQYWEAGLFARFDVQPQENYLIGFDWPRNEELNITIDGVDYTVHTRDDGMFFRRLYTEVDIQPGDIISIADSEEQVSETHVVKSHVIDEVNYITDMVRGSAEDNSEIDVVIWCQDSGEPVSYRREIAENGQWEADFSESVGGEPLDQSINLDPDIHRIQAIIGHDEDRFNNATVCTWYDEQGFWVNPEKNIVSGWYWEPETAITVTIENNPHTVNSDRYGNFTLEGVIVEAGDNVVVDDGTEVEEREVLALEITEINYDTNTISGTAPPDMTLRVNKFEYPDYVYAESGLDGNWTADFSDSVYGMEAMKQIGPGCFGDVVLSDGFYATYLLWPDETDDPDVSIKDGAWFGINSDYEDEGLKGLVEFYVKDNTITDIGSTLDFGAAFWLGFNYDELHWIAVTGTFDIFNNEFEIEGTVFEGTEYIGFFGIFDQFDGDPIAIGLAGHDDGVRSMDYSWIAFHEDDFQASSLMDMDILAEHPSPKTGELTEIEVAE